MKNLKIGYFGWANSPCDYRRFSKVASLVGLNAEPYREGNHYDIVIITKYSDLTFWSRSHRPGPKLIFDFVDSFFKIESSNTLSKFRGISRYATGQHRHLELSYNDSIKRMVERADAMVCSTPEQKESYFSINSNVHDILDFNDDQIKVVKKDYKINRDVNFVWEGMGANAWAFREIAPLLRDLHRQRPIALHLVTDIKYNLLGRFVPWQREVKPYLRKILGDIPVYLYEWNAEMLSTICARCDIALLPIPRTPAIYWAKPENRLLMLWRMGLPVLASATPAYARCMQSVGNEQACDDLKDWENKLMLLLENENLRCESARQGCLYANTHVNAKVLCQKWVKVLESVL